MTIILSKEEQQQYDELKQNFISYYNTVLVPQLQQKEDFRLPFLFFLSLCFADTGLKAIISLIVRLYLILALGSAP